MTDTEQLRADANAWRLKAIRRAVTASRLRGTIDACLDLVDEPVTDRTAWGDGYRAGIADLREVLREFGHLEAGDVAAPEPAPAAAELTETATCCVCGGSPVTYRNFREQPFCRPCADCRCGENPCVRTGINDPAVSEGAACTEVANCDGQCCKRAEQAAPVDWQAIARQRERELKTVGEARHAAEQQLAARDAALAAYTAQLVHDQQRLARVRRLADQWQAAMRPGERHPAAAAIHRALEADDDGPSVAECAGNDVRWDLEKAGE